MKIYVKGFIVFLVLTVTVSAEAQGTTVQSEQKVQATAEVRVKGDMPNDVLRAKFDATKEALKGRLEDRKEKRDVIKTDIKGLQASWKAQVETIKKERLSVRKDFVATRFVTAVRTLENAQARVSAAIEKRSDAGKDTDAAEASLKVSIDALTAAKASLEKLKTASATAETQATALRTLAKEVETKLKESRDVLIKTLRTLNPEGSVKGDASLKTSGTLQAQ